MKKYGYENIEQFSEDRIKLNANPEDKTLIAYIIERIMASEISVKNDIMNELMDFMLDTKPSIFVKYFHKYIAKDAILVIKDKENPYFEV